MRHTAPGCGPLGLNCTLKKSPQVSNTEALRGEAGSGEAPRPPHRAVPLPRQGQPRHDRSRPRRRRSALDPAEWLRRVGGLASGAPVVPHRLPEPPARVDPLGVQLPHPRSRCTGDRHAARLIRTARGAGGCGGRARARPGRLRRATTCRASVQWFVFSSFARTICASWCQAESSRSPSMKKVGVA